MNYQEKAPNAKSIYQQGLLKVATEPMPNGQKFPPKSFVKIADDLGSMMSHFTKGVYAQVQYTYLMLMVETALVLALLIPYLCDMLKINGQVMRGIMKTN